MECFARSTFERQLLEQEDLLLQFARRIPGLYQDGSCHGGPPDSLYIGLDPFSEHHKSHTLTNTAICERNHLNEIVPRRFSIGLSGLSAHNDTTSMFDLKECIANDKLCAMRDISNEKWFSYQGAEKLSAFDWKASAYDSKGTPLSPMKVSTSLFDDARMPAIRRSSIDSVESFASESFCDDEEVMQEDGDDVDIDDHENYSNCVDNEPVQFGNDKLPPAETAFAVFSNYVSQRQVHFPTSPAIALPVPLLQSSSPLEVKEAIDSFTESMTKSMRSQQAIHDWDRKMGLKRSHSKTMRLSMRSRKRLKMMLKKELGIVFSKKD